LTSSAPITLIGWVIALCTRQHRPQRAVRAALQQWRYEPTGEAFTTLAEVSFSR